MDDLTKIDRPLHELDDETAAALFLAWRAGKPVEILATNGNWAFWASGHLCLGATYRLRPGTCDWRDSLVQRPKTEEAADTIEALQAQLAVAREQRDRAIALAEKAQDRLIEAMDRVDEARDKALDDAAQTAETRHGVWLGLGADCLVDDDISACSDIAAAIRAMKGERG